MELVKLLKTVWHSFHCVVEITTFSYIHTRNMNDRLTRQLKILTETF
jgi:hypothetical protein